MARSAALARSRPRAPSCEPGIEAISRLTAGSLNELLLDVYPRKVTVLDRKDIASTIPALRDLTSYLADTGAITASTARAMDRELD